jgi:alpha-L-rhamnosidase
VTADKQSFLCELHIEYVDGERDIICTDESWSVAMDGPVLSADIYDGEEYDATVVEEKMTFKKASAISLPFSPSLLHIS